MVYGRYNYSIDGVFKPTNITGGHHPVPRSTTLYSIQFATQLSEEMTTFEGGPLQALFITSGWWFQPPWKIWKSVGMILPNIWENKKWSKPPTRYPFFVCSIYPLPLSRCFFHVFPKVSLKKKHVAQPHEPENQISRLRPLAEQDDSNANLGFWSRCKHLSVKQK